MPPKKGAKRKSAFTAKQKRAIKEIAESSSEPRHYLVQSTSLATNTLSAVNLSAMTQGDSVLDRDGDRAELTSIRITGRLLRESTATSGTWDSVRVVLIQWHPDSNVDVPAAADLFEDTTQSTISLSPIIIDKSLRSKFTLLADKTFVLQDRANSYDSGRFERRFVIRKKLSRPILFNAGATTGRNHIYMVVLGEQTSATEDCTMSYFSALRFRDAWND